VNGYYEFINVQNGTYNVTAYTSRPLVGINGTDYILIQRFFLGNYNFTSSLEMHCADVNVSNSLNVTNALLIQRFFLGIINSFPRGSWVFERLDIIDGQHDSFPVDYNNEVIVNGIDLNEDFKGECVGDTNSSNIPNTTYTGVVIFNVRYATYYLPIVGCTCEVYDINSNLLFTGLTNDMGMIETGDLTGLDVSYYITDYNTDSISLQSPTIITILV